MPFVVYILRCSDGSYYVAHTDDLEHRLAEHQRGAIPGYTHKRRPVALVFADEFGSRVEALERERQVKGWSRAKKEALIAGNWTRLRRLTQAFSGVRKVIRGSALPSASSFPEGLRSAFADPAATLRLRSGRTGSGRLPAGKLPADLLARLLSQVTGGDSRVLIGPGVGRDAAVIDAGGPKLLIAKSDPITFAGDRIAWYAVHVNANDIACLGGRPSWFLATVLLPEGATRRLAESIFRQLLEACRSLGVALVGGHTEITQGLARPIISGAMLGEVERERLVRPDGARLDDALLLTKAIAIEGTSVLAREADERLRKLGVKRKTIAQGKRYLLEPGISVVADAQAACAGAAVHAMHDPTEGGLATALHEMAAVSNLGIAVDAGQVPVLPATQEICRAAGLDPMGLLASGALLIAVAAKDAAGTVATLAEAGVPARRIGRFVSRRAGVIMEADNGRRSVPRFARDELARFLSEPG